MKPSSGHTVRAENIRLQAIRRFAVLAVLASLVIAGCHYLAWHWIGSDRAFRPLLMTGALLEAITLGFFVWAWFRVDEQFITPVRTLANTLRTALHTDSGDAAETLRATGLGGAGPAAADLLLALNTSRESARQAGAQAAFETENQKGQLATVLQELDEAVLICTPAHRIRLCNRAAVALFAAHGEVGLGRSLAEGVAIAPIQHAWQRLCVARERGESLTTTAVCSPVDSSRLFQCRMTLLTPAVDDPSSGGASGLLTDGYLMSVRDITSELTAFVKQDRLLTEMLDIASSSAARLAGLLETPAGPDQPSAASGDDARGEALRRETTDLRSRTQELANSRERMVASAWPMEDVYASDLFDEVGRRVAGKTPVLAGESEVLRCDSLSIIALLVLVIDQVNAQSENGVCELSAFEVEGQVLLEVAWDGQAVSNAQVQRWIQCPLPEVPGGLDGPDILFLHQSELILVPASPDDSMHRIGLPLSRPDARTDTNVTASVILDRPEFYDFELDEMPAPAQWLDTPLDALSYVVFDTETTGLEPNRGDEIVQIAGMRVLNGRVLAGEVFDTLVDPGRQIPPSSTRIHGITQSMVEGSPDVKVALQRFDKFASGSVLVAHNAAFDMAFLKRRSHGVVFENPVLDTVLISAFLHDHTGAHNLEDLARRLGVDVDAVRRHSAIGDTWITAQVFVSLLALLKGRGIETLREALDACHQMRSVRRVQARYG